jgi:intein/homing endonuclease
MCLPKISDDLIIHFIRGYFDGDGSFSAYYVPAKNGRKETIKQDFTFHSKTNTMLLEI